MARYGLSHFHPTASSTPLAPRTELSRCGRIARGSMGSGGVARVALALLEAPTVVPPNREGGYRSVSIPTTPVATAHWKSHHWAPLRRLSQGWLPEGVQCPYTMEMGLSDSFKRSFNAIAKAGHSLACRLAITNSDINTTGLQGQDDSGIPRHHFMSARF